MNQPAVERTLVAGVAEPTVWEAGSNLLAVERTSVTGAAEPTVCGGGL